MIRSDAIVSQCRGARLRARSGTRKPPPPRATAAVESSLLIT
jgi:hypothetical protein